MIRVTLTDTELGGMHQFVEKFIDCYLAKDRNLAERAIVGFVLSFYRLRMDGLIPTGAGWKVHSITKTYYATSKEVEHLFQLNNVTDRIKIDAERKERAKDLDDIL